MSKLKIDIQEMKLSEQEEFELLAKCSLMDITKKGLTGRRLAALIYIFKKRVDHSITFEDCLNLNFEEATSLLDDGEDDPKELTA